MFHQIDEILAKLGEFSKSFPGVQFPPYVWKKSSLRDTRVLPNNRTAPVIDCSASLLFRCDDMEQIDSCGFTGLEPLPTFRPGRKPSSHVVVKRNSDRFACYRDPNYDQNWIGETCPNCHPYMFFSLSSTSAQAYFGKLRSKRLIPFAYVLGTDFFFLDSANYVTDRAKGLLRYYGTPESAFREFTVLVPKTQNTTGAPICS